MFLSISKKQFGWLAGLALYPVVGVGQQPRFIIHPQSMTVCTGESAMFTVSAEADFVGQIDWFINGVETYFLPDEEQAQIGLSYSLMGKESNLTIGYNQTFNGITIKGGLPGGVFSHNAYLSYKTNQQSLVAGLNPAISGTTALFKWDAHNSNFTTQYLFGVYDSDNNLITNQTTDTTYVSYDLPSKVNSTCQYLAFRVTVDQCPDSDSGFIQTEGTTFIYTKPDVSHVIAQFANETVLVSWSSDSSSAFQIVVTDLESGEQTIYNGTSPFSYIPALCGQPTNLNISVSPAECADNPAFTHSDSISLTVNCPTTVTDQPSGTQASYPSVLLAVAAIIPMLK